LSLRRDLSVNFTDCPVHLENFFLRILETRYRVVREDRPEFLFYALTGQRHRLYNCVKIYTHHETYLPNWKECDYAIIPHKVDDPRAYYLPIYAFDQHLEPMLRKAVPDPASLRAAKPHFSLLSSYADRTVARRIRFFELLNRRRKVDSAGRAVNNCGFAGIPGHEAKLEFYRAYRFIISFENKERLGWTTEKMYDPLAVHAIPIFWGDHQASRYFNPDCFINAHDFDSERELADYVLHVDETPELYQKYLRATPFHDNHPPEEFSRERILNFFERIFTSSVKPVSQRRWFFPLTKWRLAKRNKLRSE